MDPTTQAVINGEYAFTVFVAMSWTLLRVGAVLMAMPLIGTRALPARIRVIAAMAISLAITPLLPEPPPWKEFDSLTILNIGREIAVGACMGFLIRLVFEAGAIAGEVISQGMGLSLAQMSDPLRGVTSGVVGQWFYLAFGLLFFSANGHLALISLIIDSYKASPIGAPLPNIQNIINAAPTLFTTALQGAVTLALPIIVTVLAVNLAFGVLARAAPALNPMQLGLPVALLVGMFLLVMLATEIGPPVQYLFDMSFDAARRITMP